MVVHLSGFHAFAGFLAPVLRRANDHGYRSCSMPVDSQTFQSVSTERSIHSRSRCNVYLLAGQSMVVSPVSPVTDFEWNRHSIYHRIFTDRDF